MLYFYVIFDDMPIYSRYLNILDGNIPLPTGYSRLEIIKDLAEMEISWLSLFFAFTF